MTKFLDKAGLEYYTRKIKIELEKLHGLGRYLSIWNCLDGLPETNPETSPYEYKSGDFFIVGTVAREEESGESGESGVGVNYKPSGKFYVKDVPSTDIELEEVHVNDVYIFDGEHWLLLSNSNREVSFSSITGNPQDNLALALALQAKQDTLTSENAGTNISITTDEETGKVIISNTQDISGKLDKVEDHNVVYGTDEDGNQVTYSKDSFGKVDDVKVDGVSVVSDKIANIDLSGKVDHFDTMPAASESYFGQIIQYTGEDESGEGYLRGYFYECVLSDESGEESGGVFVWQQLNIQPATSLVWGNIEGNLADQTDLKNALDAKADESDLTTHTSDKNNPHEVTKAQVGLGNVDNTSDLDKPISTATQTALDVKVDHYTSLPLASQDYANKIVQYIGNTNTASDLYQGFFYVCKAQGTDPETYAWEVIQNVQPVSKPIIWVTYTEE